MSLPDRFHTFNVFENIHISKNGALSVVWQLQELNLLRLMEDDYGYYNKRIGSFLKMLPEQSDIQFIYDRHSRESKDPSDEFYSNSKNKEIGFLHQKRRHSNTLKPYFHTDVFLVVTFNHLLKDFNRPGFNNILFFNVEKPGSLLKERFFSDLNIINQIVSQVEKELDFLNPHRLESSQIIRLLSNFYNLTNDFTRPLDVRNEYFNQDLLYKDINIDSGGVTIGLERLLLLSLVELPNKIINPVKKGRFLRSPLAYFLEFQFPSRLIVSFNKLPLEVALKKISRIKTLSKGFQTMNALAERRIEEIEGSDEGTFKGIEPSLERGEDSLVDFSLSLMTWHNSSDVLQQRELEILSKFDALNAKAMIENKDALPLFCGCAPGNFVNNYRSVLLRESNAPHFINLCNYYKGMNTGISYVNADEKTVLYDIFSLENDNYNAIVVGPAGSGKSFSAGSLIHKYLEQGVPVIILDIGESYQTLTNLLEGDYIAINKENPSYLDPFFYFDPRIHDVDSPDYFDSIKFILNFVEVMVMRSDEGQHELPKHHRAVFLKTVEKFVKNKSSKDITMLDFFDYLKRDDSFFDEDPRYRDYVLKALELYLYGTMRDYFNPENKNRLKLNLDTESFSLMTFDLKGIEDEKDLLPLYAFLLTKSVSRLMESNYDRFIFVQDEAWRTLSESQSIREFTLYMYRTARKWGSSILSISQNSSDFSHGDLAAGIITNSSTKFLLRHRQEDIPATIEAFNLSAAESTAFKNLKQHEIFLSSQGDPVILKAKFSRYDYWIYTTRRDERKKREEMLEKYNGNVIRALSALVEEENV